MISALPTRAFRILVFATWAQRSVWCQYYGEQIGDGHGGHNEEHHEDHHVKPLYKYGYWVHDPKTKDVKSHWEHRDGDTVHGSYSFLQPDGHMRVVEYTADKHNGFNAHVKYMYEGHGGGSDGGSGDGGGFGGSGGGGGFGGGFENHLEDASGKQSAPIGGGGVGVGGRPKQPLHKFYKKPRTEKHGGQPGQYKKPQQFDGRPKPVAGYKKQRLSPPAEQSAEHHFGGKPNSHFDQLPKFGAPGHHQANSLGGGGGGSPERYHANQLGGGGGSPERYHANQLGGGGGSPERYQSSHLGGASPFGYLAEEQGADQPVEHFSRKYSSTTSADTSAYLTGIQYLSSEHDPVVHRQPDVAPAASTERKHHSGSSEERQAQVPGSDLEPPRPAQVDGPSEEPRDDGSAPLQYDDADNRSQERDDRDGRDDRDYRDYRDDRAADSADETAVTVQKQPLREYRFEEPPYPFEIPESVQVSGKYRKRHSPQPPVNMHGYTAASSYFPSWYGGSRRYD
ncbi:AT-rich interactive domain-containing protein 1B-like [Metopolophium dirhodum]|uniref:AT-rich interactive domain-containing protein 1B-like n=1 Tax=Metopolophium dirhodum TaxID=44670 RepID=UPI00298FA5B0|nr:AT-rich interactive domain-containing protein 1B-like [Metopolophium dirhodum]XP_060875016.1 AT-rich interactive domain-containing protein 1B-like [Metopolophium dirhodum]